MPRVHHVKKARKDNPAVKKGESYYWWKFRYAGKRYSKTRPKSSQLTQSEFLSRLYAIDEQDTPWSLEDLKDELESLQEMCEDSLQNMPEQLQDSSESGQLLQERIDGLEDWIGQLDSLEDDDLVNLELAQAMMECNPF